jgi:alpha-glucosidase
MAAPVTYQGDSNTNTTGLSVYIPSGGVFYDFYTQERLVGGTYFLNVAFDAVVPLYLKEGKIVHIQDQTTVLRSRFLDNHFTL